MIDVAGGLRQAIGSPSHLLRKSEPPMGRFSYSASSDDFGEEVFVTPAIADGQMWSGEVDLRGILYFNHKLFPKHPKRSLHPFHAG
jgi:hypothetical protein